MKQIRKQTKMQDASQQDEEALKLQIQKRKDTVKETWKRLAAEEAVKLVEDGMVIGLGSGSTTMYLVESLAQRIQEGLKIVGAVCTSQVTLLRAYSRGIPQTNLDDHPELDLAIDGADEIDDQLCLIKGGGGALFREKVVVSVARRFVVIADSSKRVPQLGHHMPLPVEVLPFAVTPIRKRLETLGATVQLRQREEANETYFTDNGNIILDCSFADGISDLVGLEAQIQRITGVLETGLFLHMTQQAFVAGPEGVQILHAS